jgi:uncharacterized protein (DUF488 family)
VGHGARSAVAFVFLLRQAAITKLVDVRAYPVSRRHPHFSREPLAAALASAGIRYEWQGKALGGMRRAGYAAHMETPLYTDAATALVSASREEAICIMCAETEPLECHRAHIAD